MPTKPAAGEREIVCSFLELQNRSQQLEREQSPRALLAPISGEIANELQSDSVLTDSPVRISYGQPGSPVSTA
jgi:hypothetical protein